LYCDKVACFSSSAELFQKMKNSLEKLSALADRVGIYVSKTPSFLSPQFIHCALPLFLETVVKL